MQGFKFTLVGSTVVPLDTAHLINSLIKATSSTFFSCGNLLGSGLWRLTSDGRQRGDLFCSSHRVDHGSAARSSIPSIVLSVWPDCDKALGLCKNIPAHVANVIFSRGGETVHVDDERDGPWR